MLDPKYVREHADDIKANCEKRQVGADVDSWIRLDQKRLALLKETEALRGERNQVALKMKSASDNEKESLVSRGRALKEEVASKEEELQAVEVEWRNSLLTLPNLTHPDTPVGKTDEDNLEIKKVGEINKLDEPKDHLNLVEKLDLVDFARGTKVAGAKFYFLKNKLALLDWALLRYAIDFMVREGFSFITTPDVAKEEVLIGKGFLPRGPEQQVYYIEGQDLALIGTSEITVLGYYMNEVLPADELPKKYVAFSHCFRTEAGSYGRESYGLYRVHQFNKVEMFAFAKPEQSEAIHIEFLNHEERFWQSLGIPYRVVDCCSGDLSGSDYRRYDIEAWMCGRNEGKGGWGEVTSTSNCLDYQSRGLNIKQSSADEGRGYIHTLNGTVVATPRALIAILENCQQADGTIKIPSALVPYCGFDTIG
ncbi:MAG: serine--tRNA ligase [Patescibacteria group bacterium]